MGKEIARSFDKPFEVITPNDYGEALLLIMGQIAWIKDRLLKLPIETPVKKRELLNIEAACKVLGVAKITLYRLSSEMKVPSYKNGKALHFYKDELLDYVASGMRKSMAQVNSDVDKEIIIQHSRHDKPLN